MAILVTGAAGFIGSHLTEALLKNGERVVALDNLDNYYDPGLKRANLAAADSEGRAPFVNCDLNDGAALEKVFREHTIDRVAHLAGRGGVHPSVADPGEHVLLECSQDARAAVFPVSQAVFPPVVKRARTVGRPAPRCAAAWRSERARSAASTGLTPCASWARHSAAAARAAASFTAG